MKKIAIPSQAPSYLRDFARETGVAFEQTSRRIGFVEDQVRKIAAQNSLNVRRLDFIIENRTSDPSDPVSGQIWLRTDL